MFIVASAEQAKIIAKRLRKEIRAALFIDLSTAESLDLVAALFGFPDGYAAMMRDIAGVTPSRWDSESSLEEVEFRRRFQIRILQLGDIDQKVAEIIIDRVKPTEKPELKAQWVPPCHAVPGEAFLEQARKELEAENWDRASELAGRGALRCAPESQGPYREVIQEAGKHSSVVRGQIAQGMIYGEVFPKDNEGAVRILLELAQGDDRGGRAMALGLLGEISMGHHGGEANPTQAAKFYEQAAEDGDAIGAINAGSIYMNQLNDAGKAEKCLRIGVSMGSAHSKYLLGMFIFGDEISGSKQDAALLIKEAADDGFEDAILAAPVINRFLVEKAQ